MKTFSDGEYEAIFVNVPYMTVDANSCRYNKGVNCGGRDNCKACGWNPENTELADARIRAQMEAYRIWAGE